MLRRVNNKMNWDIISSNDKSFHIDLVTCYLRAIIPVATAVLFLSFIAYASNRFLHEKRLEKKYEKKIFRRLNESENMVIFARETKTRSRINHERIRKLQTTTTKRTMKLEKIGYYYLEKSVMQSARIFC